VPPPEHALDALCRSFCFGSSTHRFPTCSSPRPPPRRCVDHPPLSYRLALITSPSLPSCLSISRRHRTSLEPNALAPPFLE
jgi:hypothetical protein